MKTALMDIAEEFSFQLDEFYLDLQEDGSKIRILDKDKIEERPFPGLRPFKTSEFQLFKGRDGQAEELIKRLKKNHFLAVIGSSGTGKSSLVRAGLIPQLFGGYLQEAGNKWNIAICRPGKDPIENLAIALSSIRGGSNNRGHIYDNYQDIGPAIENSLYGILEVNEMLNADNLGKDQPNLLIIIDQFEELFRFDRKELGKKNIENHFVNLLLKASLNPNSGVYVIITMRSEFLGDCVKYRGLPEAINEGQYLVPQLSRNQIKEVIEAPINLAGKKINSGLVELLINEIEESKLKENLDQLPILQHALMRTYQEAMKHGSETEIYYEHYEAIGEMEKALANHAEAKFNALAEGENGDGGLTKKQRIAKVIFQALTDASTDQKGGRRPTELKNIYAIAKSIHATEREVDEVIDHFRDNDTSFIMPPINPNLLNSGLYPDLMMDISHESLMRNWERLTEWINEEVRYGKLYRSLNERRELNEEDRSELVRGVQLKELLEWKSRYLSNATWAGRYQQLPKSMNCAIMHEDLFKKNMRFLEESELASVIAVEAEQRKLKEEIESVQKEKSRRKLIRVFAVATIISLGLGVFAFNQKIKADEQKSIALEKATDAKNQRDTALVYESEARKQKDSAIRLREEARAQRDNAIQSAKEAFELRKLATGQSERLAEQLVKSEKQIVKSEIQKEKFYSSAFLDASARESIVAALFNKPLTAPEAIPRKKYINVELLDDVNNAVQAREQVLSEPVTGLRMAEKVWKHIVDSPSNHNKDQIVQKILQNIFEKNIFYKREAAPLPDNVFLSPESSSLKISRATSRFAFNYADGIFTGVYRNDSIIMDQQSLSNTLKKAGAAGDNYNSASNVIALSYADDKIVSLRDDGSLIVSNNNGTQSPSNTLQDAKDLLLAEFSRNGKDLVTISRDGLCKIYDLSQLGSGKNERAFKVMDSSAQNRVIRKIIFSPGNKKLIRIFNNNRFDLWNLADSRPSRVTAWAGTAAAFSSDSANYLLWATTNNAIIIMDSTGKQLNYLVSSSVADEEGFNAAPINSLSLSRDLRKLLVRRGADIYLFDRNDTLNNLTKTSNEKVRCRKLSGSRSGTIKASFLNNDAVLSLSEAGQVYLWNTDPVSNNLKKAFAGIRQITLLKYEDKLESGQIRFKQIISDTNRINLRAAASYYSKLREPENLDTAILVFTRLHRLYPASLDFQDLDRFAWLLNTSLERIAKQTPAQKKDNCLLILSGLKKIVSIKREQLAIDSSDKKFIRSLANNYNDLSYYALFAKQFNDAIRDALDGLKVDPTHELIYTNLALAYLLSRQDKRADDIYREYKDNKITSLDNMPFKEAFNQDFDDLTTAGVISPTDAGVKRIKEMLGIK